MTDTTRQRSSPLKSGMQSLADVGAIRSNRNRFNQASHHQGLQFTVKYTFFSIGPEQPVFAPADQVHLHGNNMRSKLHDQGVTASDRLEAAIKF